MAKDIYNSNGYIMFDFSQVNFSLTNQTIEGIYDRAVKIIGTNKFILVINAQGRSPLPATISITNGVYVIDALIYMFSISSNDNLFIRRQEIPAGDIIDDNNISINTTFSSYKINNTYQEKATVLSATLEAGNTSISFTDDAISDNALIKIFTLPELWHNSAVVNGNTLTITFDAQDADIPVKVRII